MGYAKQPPLPKDMQILGLRAWKEDVRRFVAHRASYRCEHCNVYLGMTGDVDHKTPRRELAKRGLSPWNVADLQYLCASCHSTKTNAERWEGHKPLTQAERMARRSKVPGRNLFLAMAGIPLTAKGAGP